MAGYFCAKVGRFWGVSIIGILSGMIGCGAEQKITVDTCLSSRDTILNRAEDDICNPATLDQFETQVNRWGVECFSAGAKADGEQIWRKLLHARECAEERRRLEAKRKDCENRLGQLEEEGSTCLGVECAPFLGQIDGIFEDCSAPELGDVYEKQTQLQLLRFEERSANRVRLGKLRRLTDFCSTQMSLALKEKPRVALDRVLKSVRANRDIKKTTEPGTELDRFTQEALASCGLAIKTAVDALVDAADLTLSSEDLPRSSPKWKRAYKYIKNLKGPLQNVQAGKFFPGSMDRLKEVLEKHGRKKQEEKQK